MAKKMNRRSRRWRARRKLVLAGVILLSGALLTVVAMTLFSSRSATTPVAARPMAQEVLLVSANLRQRFDVLSVAHTDVCANIGNQPAIYAAMKQMSAGSSLHGSCWSVMDFDHYQQHIAALKAYASIAAVPADPYSMLASLASTLLQDDQNMALTPAQQAV